MKHLANIWNGFSSVFSGFQSDGYAVVNGFEADAKNLSDDMKRFGNDFKKHSAKIYGQATASKSEERAR
jgi:hypothetical protein